MLLYLNKQKMLQKCKQNRHVRRNIGVLLTSVLVVFIFLAALMAPTFENKAYAYTLLGTRSIELSDSSTSATGTSYQVQFTTTDNIQDVIVDFCPDSPLYADTCSSLTGFSAATAGFTAGTGTNGWTLVNATADHVEVQGAAATGTISFTLTNITNPSALGSFYGRIYAYTSTTTGYTSPTSPGSVSDFGGIALSTAAEVGVTARVEEQITFCVAGAAITNNCANAGSNPPNIDIGHGSPTLILDSTQVDTANAYMQITTNAVGGVVVRMKNSNNCGGLSDDSGATCGIPPVGAAASTITAGTADFGLYVNPSTGGIGAVSPIAPYNTSGEYGMDNTTTPDNVTTTYGSEIASSVSGVENVNNTLTFAATASNTTAAGIYTANMTLIATGTY